MNERITALDYTKGLGMILIVLGHNPVPNVVDSFFHSFHVPLFIISGWFVNPKWGRRHNHVGHC